MYCKCNYRIKSICDSLKFLFHACSYLDLKAEVQQISQQSLFMKMLEGEHGSCSQPLYFSDSLSPFKGKGEAVCGAEADSGPSARSRGSRTAPAVQVDPPR